MRIVELQVENVKRIVAVEIKPVGNVIEIRGKNGAGKTSVLDAIAMLLGGEKLCPPKPIRDGQNRASATANLGELRATRIWTKKGSYLSIADLDGTKKRAPQAILDKLVGDLTFDPLEFSRKTADQQRATLIQMTGIQEFLDKLAEAAETVGANRREWKGEVKRLQGAVDTAPDVPEDTPPNTVNVAELTNELADAERTNRKNETDRSTLRSALEKRQRQWDALDENTVSLNGLKDRVKELGELIVTQTQEYEAAIVETDALGKCVNALQEVDTWAIRDRINSAADVNQCIAERKQVAKWADELKHATGQVTGHTTEIERLRAERVTCIAGASYPIDGLAVTEDGVTFQGIPFSQCASSEQLRVSTAIAMSLNPKLRVLLVRDGSLLDDEHLKALYELVEANDYQLWIERVGEDGDASVTIEEGQVKDFGIVDLDGTDDPDVEAPPDRPCGEE